MTKEGTSTSDPNHISTKEDVLVEMLVVDLQKELKLRSLSAMDNKSALLARLRKGIVDKVLVGVTKTENRTNIQQTVHLLPRF